MEISNSSPDWTDEQIATLTLHWSTLSATQIGAMIKKTRNAVIGKARRLNLPAKKRTGGAPGGKRIARPVKEPQQKVVVVQQPKPVPPPLNGGLHIMELGDLHCRAVIGRGPEGLARYCGAPKKLVGKNYRSFCEGHAALYYE